jgi:hypothetical protein
MVHLKVSEPWRIHVCEQYAHMRPGQACNGRVPKSKRASDRSGNIHGMQPCRKAPAAPQLSSLMARALEAIAPTYQTRSKREGERKQRRANGIQDVNFFGPLGAGTHVMTGAALNTGSYCSKYWSHCETEPRA